MQGLKVFLKDGFYSLLSNLMNEKASQDIYYCSRVSTEQLRQMYRTGLGNKIISIKASYALNDTLLYPSTSAEGFYKEKLDHLVRDVVRYMLAFGRGGILIVDGQPLSQPLRRNIDNGSLIFHAFDGDYVHVKSGLLNPFDDDFLKPEYYIIQGSRIHPSRFIDFTYKKPALRDLPVYQYGGISELEFLKDDLDLHNRINRTVNIILEKNSTFVYKVSGMTSIMNDCDGNDNEIAKLARGIESLRGVAGSVVIDKDFMDVTTVEQGLTILNDALLMNQRNLSCNSGIPISWLFGENVKGLNSTGEQEAGMFNQMIKQLQHDHLYAPLSKLFKACGLGHVTFKKDQNVTEFQRLQIDGSILDNAFKLEKIGINASGYLEQNGLKVFDNFEDELANKYNQVDPDLEELANEQQGNTINASPSS